VSPRADQNALKGRKSLSLATFRTPIA